MQRREQLLLSPANDSKTLLCDRPDNTLRGGGKSLESLQIFPKDYLKTSSRKPARGELRKGDGGGGRRTSPSCI